MKLNGWQRLWIVVTLIGAPVVIDNLVNRSYQHQFPTEAGVRARHLVKAAGFTSNVFTEDAFKRCMASKAPTAEEVVANWNDFGDQCRLQLGGERWVAASRRYNETVAEGEAYIENELPKEQALAIAKALGKWFGFCLLAYALALVVVWVARGFEKARA